MVWCVHGCIAWCWIWIVDMWRPKHHTILHWIKPNFVLSKYGRCSIWYNELSDTVDVRTHTLTTHKHTRGLVNAASSLVIQPQMHSSYQRVRKTRPKSMDDGLEMLLYTLQFDMWIHNNKMYTSSSFYICPIIYMCVHDTCSHSRRRWMCAHVALYCTYAHCSCAYVSNEYIYIGRATFYCWYKFMSMRLNCDCKIVSLELG